MQMKSPLFSRVLLSVVLLAALILTSCGGSTSSAPPPPPSVSVSINPSSVNVPAGETQPFVATVTGSNNTSVSWSVREGTAGGTINSSGVYLAPGAFGTYHVVATSQADPTKSATATVTVAPVSVAIMPASAAMRPGGTQSFSATVTGSRNVGVIWAVQEGVAGGTITDAGLYTAPTALGAYHVIATSVADPSKSATATVIVQTSGFFTPTGSMGRARGGQTATRLDNGKVLVAGGGIGGFNWLEPFPIAELFDPATGSFTATGSTQRELHTATLLKNGKVLVAGGIANVSGDIGFGPFIPENSATAELYDPAASSFTPTGSMATPRFSHTETLLKNGQVLVTGGWGVKVTVSGPSTSINFPAIATAELYDPATGLFTSTGSMATARAQHTATLLPNGKVLVAGGFTEPIEPLGASATATAEIYDPATGSFTPTGSIGAARGNHTATLLSELPNGKVLLAGGATILFQDPAPLAIAELYDPATGLFTPTGSMATARDQHTATRLLNGKVLVAGGLDGDGVGITAAELYDPVTASFTSTGNMAMGRGDHTATLLLQNGDVLVTGGFARDSGFPPRSRFPLDGGAAIATAELYK